MYLQPLTDTIEYWIDDKEGAAIEEDEDEDYIVEQDPDFGQGSEGVSSDDESGDDGEMDQDAVKDEVSKLFHDLEKPVNGEWNGDSYLNITLGFSFVMK